MIVFKCIIFVIVFLWMIYRIGNLITRLTKNKNKLFNFLYGFITVFAVNQLILTPCILLHAPFQVAFSVTLVIDLLLVLLSFFRNDSNTIRFTKREMGLNILVGILVVGQMLLSTIIYKSNADDSFYVSLSTSSIDNEALYMEEPSMGYKAETSLLTITEQIPSLELQIGILSKISTISPAILCHSILPMIIIFISYIAYYFFGRIFFNTKHAKLFLIILSIIFLFTGFSTRFRPGYLLLRAWQGKTIFLNIGLTMVIALLIRLDKKVTKKDILLLILSNIFSIAMSSTAIFIVAFAYIGFGVLKLLKLKWKDVLKGSFEGALQAFFSNLVVFVINIFATTLKNLVQIIRAGFTSLWQAIKIIINPPKDMPKEDVYYESSKIVITGLISATTMLGSESIQNFLKAIPGLNVLLSFPIPFTEQTIGDALSLCISAVCGTILSTIAIFYMDKLRNNSKVGNLQIQLVAQEGVVMHYKIAQTWFVLSDGYELFGRVVERGEQNLTMLKSSFNQTQNTLKQVEIRRQEEMSECIEQLRSLRGE